MAAIFKTGLKYFRPPPSSLRVMTKDKTKIRLKPLVNCSKTKTNVITSLAVFCHTRILYVISTHLSLFRSLHVNYHL